jgi:tRNA-splicing ligase RtcB (3'-phosphate/5'-hydroxy nucleic acid ligase)
LLQSSPAQDATAGSVGTAKNASRAGSVVRVMPVSIVLDEPRVPVRIWTDEVEEEARQQLRNTAMLPFVFHHVAAMADVHLGKGATVGSVVATRGAICPAAVGVDIGCGMVAQKTAVRAADVSALQVRRIRSEIERSVPVGFHSHKKPLKEAEAFLAGGQRPRVFEAADMTRACCQLGTLGGGNHFIEVCADQDDGAVWLLLHSGSRNIGKSVAEIHIDKAKRLMRSQAIELADADLAWFKEMTPEFDAYIHDLQWCQEYARVNRDLMMARVLDQFARVAGRDPEQIIRGPRVNCHHNYVARERHYGVDVMVTRKGAIRARKGDLGIIPGSMGTGSFIVRGLGNPEAFDSAPHGAGRRMSRGEARRRFTTADLERQTEGVECRKDAAVVDETPGAYKDIGDVIRKSSDLVEVVASLKQIVCVKG